MYTYPPQHALRSVFLQFVCVQTCSVNGSWWSDYHVLCEVIVVHEEGSCLIVDCGHGTVEVHTANRANLAHIVLHKALCVSRARRHSSRCHTECRQPARLFWWSFIVTIGSTAPEAGLQQPGLYGQGYCWFLEYNRPERCTGIHQ